MAGHSQFKNIMYRKGAQDAKRAKQFAKLIREVTVAAKSGLPEPDQNPRLRSAITAARRSAVQAKNPCPSLAPVLPPWIMAAEIVETNRLWARTVAGIDPAWIASAARSAPLRRPAFTGADS